MHAVIFDIDGTLLRSMDVDGVLFTQSIKSVLGHIRMRSKWADYTDVSDAGIVRDVLTDNSIEGSADAVVEIEKLFRRKLQDHIARSGAFPEVPGARSFLESLQQSPHHAVAIATGGWRSSALLKLDSAGFDIASMPLATSSDSPVRTTIMEMALRSLSVKADTVTYFGDAIWDRNACRSLGWNFVAVGKDIGGLESYPTTPHSLVP